jgi:hypothetical protein
MRAAGGKAAWIALATPLLSLLPRGARADDELATCSTVTERTADEILLPLSDDPNDPPGVTIVEGETPCIAGPVDPKGILRPHIVDRDEPALALVTVAREGGVPAVHVRTRPGRWLQVRLEAIVGPANLLTFDRVIRAPDWQELPEPILGHARWVLTDWQFHEPLPLRVVPRPRPPYEIRSTEMGLTALAGARRLPLGGFDAPLRASGYAPFPRMVPSAGFALQFMMRRWRYASLFFSLNGGYSQQFSLDGWFASDSKGAVDGPPQLNLGGAWLLFGASLGAYTNRPGGILSL